MTRPTQPQIENLVAQVEQLKTMKYTDRAGVPVPVFQGDPPQEALSWTDLTIAQIEIVLATQMNWEGIGPERELAAIEDIAAGKSPSEWLEGLEVDQTKGEDVSIPSAKEMRESFAEWKVDSALRSMPESVRDSIPTDSLSSLEAVMEAVGNSQLPEAIRMMEDKYYRSLSSQPTPANEAKSDFDRMMQEAASNAKYVTRGEEIER